MSVLVDTTTRVIRQGFTGVRGRRFASPKQAAGTFAARVFAL
jgi:hypothetical protein